MSSMLEGISDRIVNSISRTSTRRTHLDAHAQNPVRLSAEDDPENPELARPAT